MKIMNVFVYLCCLLSLNSNVSSEEAALKLPILVPLTGSAAEQGKWIMEGATIASEYIKEREADDIKLMIEDTQADPKTAISILQKIKLENGINSIVTYGSGVGVALSPIVNTDKIVQLGVATASPNYRSESDFTFRNFPSADLEAEFVVDKILNKFGINEIALINIQNEYGLGTKNAIKKIYETKGGSVIFEEELDPNLNDYRSIISKLKIKKPKLVYLACYPTDGGIFLRQSHDLGLKTIFIAGPAIIGSSKFLDIAKSGAEGLIISSTETPFLTAKNDLAKVFKANYEKKFSKLSLEHIYAARSFDATILLHNANRACLNKNSDCVKDYLFNVRNFNGASGNINIDKFGDVSPNFVLMTIRNGNYVAY